MLNLVFTYRRLSALLLLVTVLILPLDSLAHNLTSGQAQHSCACHSLDADSPADHSDGEPERHHDSGTGDCSDSEEHGHDAAEIFPFSLAPLVPARPLFHAGSGAYLPKVYLSIFVPPQS